MYLRICENIAQTVAIVLVSMAYLVCWQQFALSDLLAVPNVSDSYTAPVLQHQASANGMPRSECPATASKSPARRIVLV